MLPHPDSLSIPFKEGFRDIRCSIRVEARSGAVSSRLLGTPRPTRRLARLADEFLSQAEKVVDRILPQSDVALETRLDRLMTGLLTGRPAAERSGDVYAVCRSILGEGEPPGFLLSEFKLLIWQSNEAAAASDPIPAAVEQAARMARQGVLRRCLSTTLFPEDGETDAEHNARIALMCWLAVLVRAESREEASVILDSVRLVSKAEGDVWARLLREGRLGELTDTWRRTVRYLP